MRSKIFNPVSFIRENLNQLYTFAFRLTCSEEDASDLLRGALITLRSSDFTLSSPDELQPVIFRAVYQQYRNVTAGILEDRFDRAECFSLYNHLEQRRIFDYNEKVNLLHRISPENLEEIFQVLPLFYRSLFLLRDLHGFSYAQIAFIMDIEAETVGEHLCRVNKRLQSELWKKIDESLRTQTHKLASQLS